jgi:hypothetical protein
MYAGPDPEIEVDMSMKDSSSTNTVLPKESRTAFIFLRSALLMLSVQLHTVTPAPTVGTQKIKTGVC